MDPRTQILIQAEKLFSRYGYRKTTVAEIAKAAGMAKGSIYLHFSSKQDILAGLTRVFLESLAAEIETRLNGSKPPLQRLAECLELMVDTAVEGRNRLIKASLPPDLDLIGKIVEVHQAFQPRITAILARALQSARSQGLTAADPERLAWLFSEMLFNIKMRLGPDPEFDYRHYLEGWLETVFPEAQSRESNG